MIPYKGARSPEEREIFRHGRLAGQRGQPSYDNPYAVNTPSWELWREGWRTGFQNSFPGRRVA